MYGFKQYVELNDFISFPEVEVETSQLDVGNASDAIFDLIFAVDPSTGLPCDVIQQYLSDKTSADVKEFIERTFKGIDSPESSVAPDNVHKEYSSLSDSLVADLSRDRFESVEQYEDRIKQFLQNEKADLYRDKILKELKEKNRD